jgi:hypothetical protein
LDVINNPKLMWLNCSRNLIVSLDLTSNTELNMLEIEDMPSLNSVCVAETPNLGINAEGSPNVVLSSDCSD